MSCKILRLVCCIWWYTNWFWNHFQFSVSIIVKNCDNGVTMKILQRLCRLSLDGQFFCKSISNRNLITKAVKIVTRALPKQICFSVSFNSHYYICIKLWFYSYWNTGDKIIFNSNYFPEKVLKNLNYWGEWVVRVVQWKEISSFGLRNNNCNVTMLNYGWRITFHIVRVFTFP